MKEDEAAKVVVKLLDGAYNAVDQTRNKQIQFNLSSSNISMFSSQNSKSGGVQKPGGRSKSVADPRRLPTTVRFNGREVAPKF